MKKDYRIKIPYNLKKPFGDYRSVGSLIQYFNLHSVEDASINTVIPNLANRSGKPCVGSQIGLIGDTPFQKMVKYSVNLEATTNSYYRIEYGNQTDQPFTNNDEAFSISLWVRLPNLRVAVPDNESVIFNKILAGEPSANWSTSGEMALTYMSGDATFRFELAGQEGLSSPGTMTDTTLTFSSKPINTLDNVKFRDGEWVHVVVVKKRGIPSTAPGGQSLIFDNTLSYIDPWIKIYINGQDATDTSSGAVTGYNAGTASQPVMFKFKPNSKQGDITLGRGKGDDGTSTDDTACGLYDFAVWKSELSKESIKEIWSRSQYHQGSGLLTVSPRVQIRKEVNREAPYLSARNTPRVNLPNKPFNDNDSFIFKPTTIPNQSFQINSFALTTNRSRIGLETPGNFKGHRIFSERPAEVLPSVNGALSFNRWLYASPVIQTWDIQSVIKGTVTEIQTLASSDVRSFDRVIIRDAKGISGVNNQYFYAQNVSNTNFKLFHDPNLTIPVDTSTSDNHAPNTGIVYVESAKYLDLFEDFYKTKPALKLSGNIDQAQQSSPCEIDTVEPHGLSDGSQIYIEMLGE